MFSFAIDYNPNSLIIISRKGANCSNLVLKQFVTNSPFSQVNNIVISHSVNYFF